MINIKDDGKPLVHFWSKCVGAGRAKEGLRAAWQEQLREAKKQCGFEYIRFHGLFHDDMCVYRKYGDREVYNFQYVDDLFDALLEIGIRPFVELGFMPWDMASGDANMMWWKTNITPPKDWAKWEELITKAVSHWVDRYGISEVSKWYFEVWNEANLHHGFWTGGKSGYFKMYEITARAIKAINPILKVGGPATSNFVPDDRFESEIEDQSKHLTHKLENLDDGEWRPVWMKEFTQFCSEKGLPVDFFSTHPYPTDFALDGHGESAGKSRSVNSTRDDLAFMRKFVDNSPYKGAEIHLTEWNSSPSSRDMSHDYPAEAAFIVKTNIDSRGLVDSLSYWAFTDIFEEFGAGDTAFHGGFGMINYQGVKKPAYHAYRFLSSLGDTEIASGENYIVTKDKDGKCAVLAYNYNSDTIKSSVPMADTHEAAEKIIDLGKECTLETEICGLKPGAMFAAERVSAKSGCALGLYKDMGYPAELTTEQIKILRSAGENLQTEIIKADKDGVLKINTKMSPWEIMLIKEL